MLPSARWLVPASALVLAVGAASYTLPRWLRPDPVPSRAGDGVDWAEMLDQVSAGGFDQPSGAWELALPADHGAHPEARTETWSIAAHLRTPGGEAIGVQFALLRIATAPPDAEHASSWGLQAVYRGHVALLDAGNDRASGEERFHRALPGAAGHDAARREVRLDNWSLVYGEGLGSDQLRLGATVDEVDLELRLTPAKPPVALNLEGDGAPFRGYAITRLRAEGAIGNGADRRPVSGLAWLDHVWGDLPLPLGPIVADRLQLQLDDGTDLSITRTRRRDGGGTPTLAAYAVDPHGRVQVLADATLAMQAVRTWRGGSGGPYPIEWRLSAGELRLDVAPLRDDQLLDSAAPVWSGAVASEGVLRDRRVSGRGTLVLTGGAVR
jgi:predicted secreted hydrolase